MEWIKITTTNKPDYEKTVYLYFPELKETEMEAMVRGFRKFTDKEGDHYQIIGGRSKDVRLNASYYLLLPDIPEPPGN